jgi:DNA (cytosine-5)-methyltransferase 1
MDKLRVFSAFAGYGTDNFALKQVGIPFECVGYSEIDKYASICFNQNHWTTQQTDTLGQINVITPKNYGDIRNIKPEDLPDYDLFTGGFPCQAFSVAGKGLGELDPRGTLFYEIIRINEVKKPKYMLLENVKGLTSKKHRDTFNKILSELDRIGYEVDWKVVNTRDYGIPQNRERVFFICHRKDILIYNKEYNYVGFEWPDKEELKLFIKDILEPEPVDTKYYLKETQIQKLLWGIEKKLRSKRNVLQDMEVSDVLCARDYKTPKCVEIKSDLIKVSEDNIHQHNRVYDSEGVSPSLNTNTSPKVFNLKTRNVSMALEVAQDKANEEGKPSQIDLYHLQHGEIRPLSTYIPQNSDVNRCLQAGEPKEILVFPNKEDSKFIDTYNQKVKDICPTLTDPCHNSLRLFNKGIFRRLTPKECFRLQDFLKDEINLDGLSDTQKYKLCGNGQSVNVVRKIFERMFR